MELQVRVQKIRIDRMGSDVNEMVMVDGQNVLVGFVRVGKKKEWNKKYVDVFF